MGLRPLFDITKRRGWLASLVSVVLLFGFAAAVLGDLPKDRPDRDRTDERGLTASTTPVITTIEANRVIAFLTERGEFGASAGSVAGGGFWRATTDQYIFSSGINVAAVANGDTLVAIGGPFSQLIPGSPTIPNLGVFWDSTDPEDAASFPEVCTVDSFRSTVFPTLQPFEGLPFPGFADQTICIAVNDITGSSCSACAGTRLGIESDQTYFEFGVPAVQDFAFTIYRIFNRSSFVTAENAPSQTPGPYTFEDTTVAIAIDPDVGEAGDDQIAFLPDVRTMVYWDSDFNEPQFQNPPGFGGVTALDVVQSTVVNAGLVPAQDEVFFAEFTVFTNGAPRPDPSSKEEWYEGMTGDLGFVILEVSPQDIRGMVATSLFDLPPGEFVELYGAFFMAEASGSLPSDLRAEAYKDLGTGEINENANTDPVFDNFKNTQRTAQSVFDAGFIVPTAPPKPDVQLIPGDMKVTLAWDAEAVESVNPFAKVARDPFVRLGTGEPDPDAPGVGIFVDPDDVVFDPASDQGGTTGFVRAGDLGLGGVEATNAAFDPGFVIQDFQSFKVYRSLTGQSDDAELIGAFDLADQISTGEFCTNALVVFEGNDPANDPLSAVCTETEEIVVGENSGLNFALIDRGGTFPNPGDGPGLINGIPVFYAVTSVSVNCGQLLVDVPESVVGDLVPPPGCLTLEAGLSPMQSVVPRSETSALTGGTVTGIDLLDGDGNVVPEDPGPVVAGQTIPPARDWDVDVNLVQPEEIPEDFTALLQIEGMPMSSSHTVSFAVFCPPFTNAGECFGLPDPTFRELPSGAAGLGIQLRVSLTDGDGNVLQTPTGPAQDIVTSVGPANFGANTSISTPTIQVLSPKDPANGVAMTLSYETIVGPRNENCATFGACAAFNEMPPSVAEWEFSRGNYPQSRVATVELTWSNQGGVLSLSSVRDVSNNVDMPFDDFFGHIGWGFFSPTSLRGAEDAFATDLGVPRTDDGRVLYPDPLCLGGLACDLHGGGAGFTQGAPIWEDLPVDPEIFSRLEAGPGWPTDRTVFQPGALQETAELFNFEGNPGTRLSIAGHTLSLVFNQLPADGETWTLHFPRGDGEEVNAEAVRAPMPGMAVRVQVAGATTELADADLSEIAVVPNPFIAANEITRGRGLQRILFTNLPPRATIRIYTVSGNLVRILEHSDGSGTAEWDVRTRFDLLVASGIYYWHVTTPDGRTQLGRFAVVN